MFADLRDLEDLPEFSWFEGGGYIGVRPVEMTPELRTHFGAPKDAGVFVGKVEKDSPAAKAGLLVADIVTSADGEQIGSTRDLVRAVRRKKEGETVKIELLRDRSPKTLTVTVSEREGGKVHLGEYGRGKRGFRWRGVPPVPPVAPVPPGSPDLQDRLDDLEKRLDALEGRTPEELANPSDLPHGPSGDPAARLFPPVRGDLFDRRPRWAGRERLRLAGNVESGRASPCRSSAGTSRSSTR